MSLSIGIVGLPNVGKSTLFNALLKRQVALAANYPFATIDPNIGVVDVPDNRLYELAKIVESEYSKPGESKEVPEKIIPAVVKFYDIAGLVKGASEGEGLGNKFLSHIREVDAIAHVVRDFDDPNVIREGSVSAKEDKETIEVELILADLAAIDSRLEKHQTVLKRDKSKDNLRKQELYELFKKTLGEGSLINSIPLSEEDSKLVNDLNLLTAKPFMVIYNIDESKISTINTRTVEKDYSNNIYLCAKIESELSALSEEDQQQYMKELGIASSGLDQVIQKGYRMLDLQTFYTAGPKEVRAWTIKKGTKAPKAAGVIHTDFERGFIKAMVVSFDDLIQSGSFKTAQERGLLRMEGKEYIMQVGDIVEFRFNV